MLIGLAVTWALVAALVLMASLSHRAALATRDHAVAERIAQGWVESLAATAPEAWPAGDTVDEGSIGAACTWQVAVTERLPELLRLRLDVRAGRATYARMATVHAP